MDNAFAYTIHDSRTSTWAGTENEQNKFNGRVSTIMRPITQRDGDLSTYVDVTDEKENAMKYTSIKQIHINNHAEANWGLIRGHLLLG